MEAVELSVYQSCNIHHTPPPGANFMNIHIIEKGSARSARLSLENSYVAIQDYQDCSGSQVITASW